MKRYYLGVMMLALGAAGLVWVAIKQRPAATAAVAEPPASASSGGAPTTTTPAASALPTPASAPTEDVQIGDAGHLAVVDPVAEGGQTFPPLAADAAWSVVRWTMSAADVELALRDVGVIVADATDTKTGAKRLRAKSGPWDATIDFGAKSVDQIVVTATNLSKEAAYAVIAKMKERAPATKTIDRTERRWKKEGGAVASLVTYVDGTTATVREEHVRESSPGGAIGFAGLRWGMSTQEVVGQLMAAGYVVRVVKASATDLASCSVPNPPPDCAKKSHAETVPFNKGEVEGMASLNQFGLRQVGISGMTADSGVARAKELESSLGKAASVEASTKTQHVDHARMTSIDVEVTEKQPGGGFTVFETYRPKKPPTIPGPAP
jgi:hypothetical protein